MTLALPCGTRARGKYKTSVPEIVSGTDVFLFKNDKIQQKYFRFIIKTVIFVDFSVNLMYNNDEQAQEGKRMANTGGGELAAYLFHQGTNFFAYEYLGCHRICVGGEERLVFRVWAPNAKAVALTGDFNCWGRSADFELERITESGIWEKECPNMENGTRYKYIMTAADGRWIYKSDPYAFAFGRSPETASVVWSEPGGIVWHDENWLASRPDAGDTSRPLNVYEVHLGSWMRHDDGSYLTYRETAAELAPYVKRMGYTHVELMPVAEHPFDGSWGYQVTGYYAPTSRYGTPEDFAAFVDVMHEAGVGVILDWVPAHFPKDDFGLCEFDGQPLYEYQGADRMEHSGWGTRRFDVGRPEVQSFLVSNATFWAKEYHVDGIRVDAVASMLYLDYDKRPGEWVPNIYGDNRCLEAMAFFRKLNRAMKKEFPSVMMIAEESSAWGGITDDGEGGLGFSYKWNMGWMNDSLEYLHTDPIFKKYHHAKLTFSMTYAFGEKYILPISHDEVVHGKLSLLDRAVGDYAQKFASTRAFLTYMMTHPGKKLLFMGCEIGQFREWDYAGQIEWFLLDYEMHEKFQHFAADLNHVYLGHDALWQKDTSWDGFEWIDPDNSAQSVISYRRTSDSGEIVAIINFTPAAYSDYRIGIPTAGEYKLLLSSDDETYGGEGRAMPHGTHTEPIAMHGRQNSISVVLPPLTGILLELVRADDAKHNTQKDSSVPPERRATRKVPRGERAATRNKKAKKHK